MLLIFFIKLINEDKIVRIKEVYEYIATKYGTTTSNVEKAMRYVKEQCDYYTQLELKKKKNKQIAILYSYVLKKYFIKMFHNNVSQ